MSPLGSSIRRFAGVVAGAVLLGSLVAPAPAQAAAGDISTAAGSLGTGTSTSLGMSVRGLAVTGTTLYLADQDASVVRKVNLTNSATTIAAGIGVGGGTGDGGQATAAMINRPSDVAVDSSGNIYIASWYENKVRKINIGTGVITTIAGTGTQGTTGDGGQATSAAVDQPRSVAVNSSGEVFIAEFGGNVVRKVATNGVISTFASGFGQLRNVAVDSSNRVYTSDCSGARINRYPAAGGAATLVAGGNGGGFSGDGAAATAAAINCPIGVAVDSSNNIYIGDNGNNRIRKVTAADGKISTLAGTGTAGYSGDGGAGTSAMIELPFDIDVDSSGNVFFAQRNNFGASSTTTTSAIRKITSGGTISTVAGNSWSGYSGDSGAATSAQLANPSGVATDSSNALYIADTTNNRIRKVASGTITTVAGNGYPCVSACGVSNIGDGGAATSGNLSGPQGVAVNGSGDIFISDTLHHRIRKVSGGNISTVAGTGTAGYSGDGGTATSAAINTPTGLTVAANGNVYFADKANNRIRMINGTTITTVAGTGTAGGTGDGGAATSATLNQPSDVAIDTAGNIYIADTGNNAIRMITAGTGKISTIAGTGSSGNSGDGGPATSAALNQPAGVEDDAYGNIYVADTGNNQVRRINRHGIVNTIAGTGAYSYGGDGSPGAATGVTVAAPTRVAIDNAGNVYIAASGEMRVRKLATQTGAATWWSSDSTTGHSDATYGWEFVATSTTAFRSITFTVPSATNSSATGLYVTTTVGMPNDGTLSLSGGTLTYTLAANETPLAGEHYYLAVAGFTNTGTAGSYLSTVTTRTSTPATIDVSVSGVIDLVASGTAELPIPNLSTTVTAPATTTLLLDPLTRPDVTVPVTATITTNAAYGYSLDLKSTAITGTGGTLAQVSTGIAGAVATGSFGVNRFGYQVSSVGGSAAGVAQGNLGGAYFAGYKTTGEAAVVSVKGTATTGDTVTVNNRARIDRLQPAGVYTGTMTWTATPQS